MTTFSKDLSKDQTDFPCPCHGEPGNCDAPEYTGEGKCCDCKTTGAPVGITIECYGGKGETCSTESRDAKPCGPGIACVEDKKCCTECPSEEKSAAGRLVAALSAVVFLHVA